MHLCPPSHDALLRGRGVWRRGHQVSAPSPSSPPCPPFPPLLEDFVLLQGGTFQRITYLGKPDERLLTLLSTAGNNPAPAVFTARGHFVPFLKYSELQKPLSAKINNNSAFLLL